MSIILHDAAWYEILLNVEAFQKGINDVSIVWVLITRRRTARITSQQRHHQLICSMLDQGKPKPKEVSVEETKTTTTMSNKAKGTVPWQTAKAMAVNDVNSKAANVKILLDTRSQRSYITSWLKLRLNLSPVKSETLHLNTFGDERYTKQQCSCFKQVWIVCYKIETATLTIEEKQGTVKRLWQCDQGSSQIRDYRNRTWTQLRPNSNAFLTSSWRNSVRPGNYEIESCIWWFSQNPTSQLPPLTNV